MIDIPTLTYAPQPGAWSGKSILVYESMTRADRGPTSAAAPAEELSVPAWVYPYRLGLSGGALGGLVMIGVALVYGWQHNSVWLPVNLIGATVVRGLQTASLAELSTFNLAALIAGLTLHMIMSVGLGFVFALLLPTLPGPVLIWSLTIGPALWVLASLLTLPLIDPVMNQYVDRPSFFAAHFVYGLVLGLWFTRAHKVHV